MQQPLRNYPCMNKDVIGIDLAFDGPSIVCRFSMKILITGAPLQWFHIFHPEVVGEGANDVNRLLKDPRNNNFVFYEGMTV